MEETLIEKVNGWAVLSQDGKTIYDFTFKRTRRESIKRWEKLWEQPNNWKAHYRKGYRCVKVQITLRSI